MHKVTLWYKLTRNKAGEVTKRVFNHLDDGWKLESKPLPKSEEYSNQAAWVNEEWSKELKHMTEDFEVVD